MHSKIRQYKSSRHAFYYTRVREKTMTGAIVALSSQSGFFQRWRFPFIFDAVNKSRATGPRSSPVKNWYACEQSSIHEALNPSIFDPSNVFLYSNIQLQFAVKACRSCSERWSELVGNAPSDEVWFCDFKSIVWYCIARVLRNIAGSIGVGIVNSSSCVPSSEHSPFHMFFSGRYTTISDLIEVSRTLKHPAPFWSSEFCELALRQTVLT